MNCLEYDKHRSLNLVWYLVINCDVNQSPQLRCMRASSRQPLASSIRCTSTLTIPLRPRHHQNFFFDPSNRARRSIIPSHPTPHRPQATVLVSYQQSPQPWRIRNPIAHKRDPNHSLSTNSIPSLPFLLYSTHSGPNCQIPSSLSPLSRLRLRSAPPFPELPSKRTNSF
jgi:hypothetical protein